jgi:hypothetical protein
MTGSGIDSLRSLCCQSLSGRLPPAIDLALPDGLLLRREVHEVLLVGGVARPAPAVPDVVEPARRGADAVVAGDVGVQLVVDLGRDPQEGALFGVGAIFRQACKLDHGHQVGEVAHCCPLLRCFVGIIMHDSC